MIAYRKVALGPETHDFFGDVSINFTITSVNDTFFREVEWRINESVISEEPRRLRVG